MTGTKIIELFIDDEYEEAGIEAISLVSRPAHEENWQAFNSQLEEAEPLNPYTIIEDDFCSNHTSLFNSGEPYLALINDGWDIVKVEKITPQDVYKMQQEKFSSPNDPSQLDTENLRIRYKYIGPRDNDNRAFCASMLANDLVYRIEDIEKLSNPEFGSYNIFLFRGSFNCRHAWVRLLYKKQGQIRNDGSSTKNRIEDGEDIVVGADTRNRKTKEAANRGETKAGKSTDETQWKPGVERNGLEDRQYLMAEEEGLEDACWEGYEAIGTKILDGREVPNCVPIKMTEDDFAESITDYPEGVKGAAQRALNYAEKNGWGSCGTGVGKQRANQLAKGEPISVDTVKRMYSYLSRHKVDLQSSTSYEKGCGKLMYDAWGGAAGLTWSERKLGQLEKEKMSFAQSHMTFALDDEKKMIIGAAMVPNKMIIRYDDLGNPYYVYFSKESIKKMAGKFMKEQRTDQASIEHDGKKLGKEKVFITESWVSEDPIHDKSYKYGFNLPSGTWYVQMKINDDKVWKMIKEKSLNGFSVEGLFAEKSMFSKEDKQINQITQILKSITDE
jgi:hypothetical protein